ncbi:MAG: hypothetical protein ABSC56_12230 [Solirubrobacteraceae bacterium]|jgi:hypothetical protein
MRRHLSKLSRRPTLPATVAALAVALMLIGGLLLVRPHLRGGVELDAGVPDPPALFAATLFTVPPHGRACLGSVTIDADSYLAQFDLWPVKASKQGGPPVDLLLRAPGYSGIVRVPGGYHGGSATLPIQPVPKHSRIGTACFVNVGTSAVALTGTTEPRTVSRSPMTIDGTSVVGDVALTFIDSRSRSLLDEVAGVFDHASNLTDGLLPPALIWLIAILVVLSVPFGTVAAFYLALREDEQAARPGAGAPGSAPHRSAAH